MTRTNGSCRDSVVWRPRPTLCRSKWRKSERRPVRDLSRFATRPSSASFHKLALFLIRKLPQKFTLVRLLVLFRSLVTFGSSVLEFRLAAMRFTYFVHYKRLRILPQSQCGHSRARKVDRGNGCPSSAHHGAHCPFLPRRYRYLGTS